MKRNGIYNRIWLPVALVLTVLLGIVSFKDLSVQALALEQQARCGIVEHIHGDACYANGNFVCDTPVHTHTENCYLVLLKDNDINVLLIQMEQQPDNALETVIEHSVDTALQFNRDLTSPFAAQDILASDVAAINDTIQAHETLPQVTLNENLHTSYGGQEDDLPQTAQRTQSARLPAEADASQQVLPTDALPDGTMSMEQTENFLPEENLSLDDPVSTASGRANYYIYLNNGWRTVGTLTFTSEKSGNRYNAYQRTSDIVNLYNESLGLNLTASNLTLNYATSATSNSWTRATKSGSYTYYGTNYSRQNTARTAKYIRLVDSSGNPLAFYSVTLRYLDGTETVQYVRSGTSITLPEESAWRENSTEYAGGEDVSIYSARTFTEELSDGRLRISYDVNFPTVSGVTVSTKPTIMGTTVTETVDIIELETDARIRNVSQQNVIGKVNDHAADLSRVFGFKGWQIEGTDTVLSANATLTWEELQAYVGDKRILKLLGVWETRAQQTASFYIRYDSVAVDTEGNMTSQDSNLYTPELFAAFVGGDDAANLSVDALNNLYYIADTTSDNSYGADQDIRSLYGQTSDIWLQSFPKDEDIFEQLKDYADYLEVDGEPVDVNELNQHAYTIRWYVFKCQSDAWHIDGRLVKKEGYLDITKSFAGNKQAVAEAMDGFYMTATNADGSKRHTLYLDDASSEDGMQYLWTISGVSYGEQWTIEEYPGIPQDSNMVVHSSYRVVDAYNTQNKSGDGTLVDVSGMTYDTDMGEIQALRVEFTNIYHETDSVIIKKEDYATGNPLDGAVFALVQNGEYLRFTYDRVDERYIYDPDGAITELTGDGYYELVVEGFSYDNGYVEVLELRAPDGYTPVENIILGYLDDGSIGILNDLEPPSYDTEYIEESELPSEADEPTDEQESEDEILEDEEEDTFTEEETADELPTDAETEEELLADAEAESETVEMEELPPELFLAEEASKESSVERLIEYFRAPEQDLEEEFLDESLQEEEASEDDTKERIIISIDDADDELPDEQESEEELLADEEVAETSSALEMASYDNGLLTVRNSTDSTSVTAVKQWLCPEEEWQPITVQLLANGLPVTALISGVEPTMVLNEENDYTATWDSLPLYANGAEITWSIRETKIGNEDCLPDFTFANWLVDYDYPDYTYDETGRLVNTSFTVSNDTKRTMLRLVKTNLGGGLRLEGATFTLERLINGEIDSNFIVRTMTTGADGVLTFDNLLYGDYRLTEIHPPDGYFPLDEPAYLTIGADGTVTVQGHPYVLAGSTAFSVQVLNQPEKPLPLTGGEGTGGYTAWGITLLASALGIALLKLRRKEGFRSG